ncbi:uncharacterized protein LOC116611771 isoform X2 [Nematostella vectensis]|nr:uncharacterized protein LOC116611771 isoform X2 [Nematostella vectensis]
MSSGEINPFKGIQPKLFQRTNPLPPIAARQSKVASGLHATLPGTSVISAGTNSHALTGGEGMETRTIKEQVPFGNHKKRREKQSYSKPPKTARTCNAICDTDMTLTQAPPPLNKIQATTNSSAAAPAKVARETLYLPKRFKNVELAPREYPKGSDKQRRCVEKKSLLDLASSVTDPAGNVKRRLRSDYHKALIIHSETELRKQQRVLGQCEGVLGARPTRERTFVVQKEEASSASLSSSGREGPGEETACPPCPFTRASSWPVARFNESFVTHAQPNRGLHYSLSDETMTRPQLHKKKLSKDNSFGEISQETGNLVKEDSIWLKPKIHIASRAALQKRCEKK